MQPIKSNRSRLRMLVSSIAVVVLLVGVFSAVTLSLQSQDSRSRASGYANTTNYYSGTNSYSGGLISCISVLFIQVGNCRSGATVTPAPPCGTTTTYSTSMPTQPCPTIVPTGTTYGGPAPTTPTTAPTAVPAYGAGNASANLVVYLHGIGKAGDNANENAHGNSNPLHPQRNVKVSVFNNANQLVSENAATISFDAASGVFKGQANLAGIESGGYTVKIKTEQYLRKLIPGIQNLTKGQTVTFPEIRLVVGDINNDNQINILDYNILIGCYSDLSAANNCTQQTKLASDINDDGFVNQFDYNLFIRELSNVSGQ